MSDPSASECRVEPGHCITCSDEGVAMLVLEVQAGAAVCADSDRRRQRVELDLVGPVSRGDQLLVHAGVAIANLGATG
ncbi:MAG: HypC/HybG/HupF family hydrogenase formation chaperone [Solirubrobacterales bacterium]|nr:HypC/HybG/HupF family hydrogenase formation chaperone [Solirubrobacterales bacterium]MBV9049061.1 HypC/HybG/HupF family hydrogenase formation chaperone [Solirubrobacterales bacterium]